MAEIIQAEKKESGKNRSRKRSRISNFLDMTPMVDLMCLLITFFMLTTAFSKPKIMEITMPDNHVEGPPTTIPDFRTINILLSGNNKIFYYNGSLTPKTGPVPILTKTNFGKDGIRKILLERNQIIFKKVEELKEKVVKGNLVMSDSALAREIKKIKKNEDKNYPIVLIKADDEAKYRNIVDIIDEMEICNIAGYAVVPICEKENTMLSKEK
jgi:biopolymer transport protein ExbD